MESSDNVYDVVIIGAGPAGLTAGIYAARARMKTLIIESLVVMGQATMTEIIENYPGVEKVTGFDLVTTLKKQAEGFGAKCRMGTVVKISRTNSGKVSVWKIEDENGSVEALSVIAASGARPKKLKVPGEEKFLGRGVSYCATCDGAFFRDKDIVVIGGGDTVVEEAIFLTRFGKKVTIIHRRDRLRATKILQERAFANEKIDYVWGSVVDSIVGVDKVERVVVVNKDTGKKQEISCEGVFIFTGWRPNTDFSDGVVKKDEYGAILADKEMKTSAPGIFAGGDCCRKILHQVVTACGDGAVAAFSAQHYVEKIKGTEYK
ncbi:MAG: thioredoxin-disulfide reductase [Candidatus Omnitrophica bacterium]|nr:thioredoxin-disulfide reductase [Candidatus Omnitrophota bacterium]